MELAVSSLHGGSRNPEMERVQCQCDRPAVWPGPGFEFIVALFLQSNAISAK